MSDAVYIILALGLLNLVQHVIIQIKLRELEKKLDIISLLIKLYKRDF